MRENKEEKGRERRGSGRGGEERWGGRERKRKRVRTIDTERKKRHKWYVCENVIEINHTSKHFCMS